MQSTAIWYVGIEVHQATLVCAVKDESGRAQPLPECQPQFVWRVR